MSQSEFISRINKIKSINSIFPNSRSFCFVITNNLRNLKNEPSLILIDSKTNLQKMRKKNIFGVVEYTVKPSEIGIESDIVSFYTNPAVSKSNSNFIISKSESSFYVVAKITLDNPNINNEIAIYRMTNNLVYTNFCPYFNYLYLDSFCSRFPFKFSNQSIIKKINNQDKIIDIENQINIVTKKLNSLDPIGKYTDLKNNMKRDIHNLQKIISDSKKKFFGIKKIILVQESGDDIFDNFIPKNKNIDLIYSLLFQILFGIMVLNKKLNVMHGDFHLKNILISKTQKPEYNKYIINGVAYYLYNHKYLAKILDFGKSKLFPELNNKKKKKYIKRCFNTDTANLKLIYLCDLFRFFKLLNYKFSDDKIKLIMTKLISYSKGQNIHYPSYDTIFAILFETKKKYDKKNKIHNIYEFNV